MFNSSETSNFLVADDYAVKMIDFGVSRMVATSVIMTTVGTPTFMAPEVLNGEMYGESADVYSFAMVIIVFFFLEKNYVFIFLKKNVDYYI